MLHIRLRTAHDSIQDTTAACVASQRVLKACEEVCEQQNWLHWWLLAGWGCLPTQHREHMRPPPKPPQSSPVRPDPTPAQHTPQT